MGKNKDREDREFGLSPSDPDAIVRERTRKLYLLQRIALALGVPVDDFYMRAAESQIAKVAPDSDQQG